MKIAFIAHAGVAQRGARFAAEFARQIQSTSGEFLEFHPAIWGSHHRKNGWIVERPGDIVNHDYPPEAWQYLLDWEPDVIVAQQEAYSLVARRAAEAARLAGSKFVLFTWENVRPPDAKTAEVLRRADLNLFGNSEARRLVAETGIDTPAKIIPQCGIDASLFAPHEVDGNGTPIDEVVPRPRDYDFVFAGRNTPMKGVHVLNEAVHGTPWKVRRFYEEYTTDWTQLPKKYRSAKIQVTPSVDIPGHPREQWAPATTIEGLLTGLPVVTTAQPAIEEWLTGCPAAYFVEPGDSLELQEMMEHALEQPWWDLGAKGRDWALRFSNEAVAKEYVHTIKELTG